MRSAAAPLTAPDVSASDAEGFRSECARLAEEAERSGSMAVRGEDGWLFLGSELRHLGSGEFWGDASAKVSQAANPKNADPLPAILDFKAQLDRAGIELLMVPVPPKAVIYSAQLSPRLPGKPRLDEAHQKFYALLRRSGVRVLDLVPDFLQRRDSEGPLYCKTDTHWSGRGCTVAARSIAREIQSRPWLKAAPKIKATAQAKTVSIEGDLARSLRPQPPTGQPPREALPLEALPLRFVSVGRKPIEPSHTSPIVLLGDSHNLIFHAGSDMLAAGAGLPDQLALELGLAVDLIAVRGSGATPARVDLMRRARADASYLKGKKLVIWCFSAREFTESSGWQKVPLQVLEGAHTHMEHGALRPTRKRRD